MGIWSQCIYVDKPDLQFDVLKIPDDVIYRLHRHGFFEKFLSNEEKNRTENCTYLMTLKEFSNECYETAKIYGYLDRELKLTWYNFINNIGEQNPSCNSFEIHFYCSDENIPYCFSYSKQTDENSNTYKNVKMKLFPYNHVYYTNVLYWDLNNNKYKDGVVISEDNLSDLDFTDKNNQYITHQFDICKYIKLYKQIESNVKNTTYLHPHLTKPIYINDLY